MNILKNKKIIATTLTFVLVMILAHQPLSAKERRGATVVVTLTDGRMVRGELLAVKDDALLVYDYKGERLDLQQVFQVKVLKKSKILTGLGIGLVLGLGYCVHYCEILGNNEDYERMRYMYYPPIASLLGGLIGARAGMSVYFDLAEAPPPTVRKNLQSLKRYARERNTDSNNVHAARLRRNFFDRLRLLWLPVLLVPFGSISSGAGNGTFRFVESGSSKDTDVYEFEPFIQKVHKEYKNNRRFRLEYEWTPHLSTGLEYLSVVESENWYRYDLVFVSADFKMNYASYLSVSGGGFYYTYDSLLLGLNWKPLPTSSSGKEVIELGIAAGPARANEKTHSPMREIAQSNISTWMAKVHFAYDHFFNDNLSFGGFIEFQHLPAQFSGVKYIETLAFGPKGIYDHEYQIKRQTEITIPEHKTQLGGLAYGLRLGLRF